MAEIYPASVILSILLCHSEAQPKNLFYAPPGWLCLVSLPAGMLNLYRKDVF